MTSRFAPFFESQKYHQTKNVLFNYRLRKRKVATFLKQPQPPILDVGCGISPMVQNRAHAILGDNSLAAMRAARGEGFTTVVLDVERLGARPQSLATVVCSEVLEHIEHDHQALTEIHRSLRPGGDLILTVPLHGYYWHRDDEIVGHYRRYELGALIRELRDIGFEVVGSAKIGSLFERYLTLAAAVTFLRTDRAVPTFGPVFLRLFSLANWALAGFLQLAAVLSPQRLNSLQLLRCRKTVQVEQPH